MHIHFFFTVSALTIFSWLTIIQKHTLTEEHRFIIISFYKTKIENSSEISNLFYLILPLSGCSWILCYHVLVLVLAPSVGVKLRVKNTHRAHQLFLTVFSVLSGWFCVGVWQLVWCRESVEVSFGVITDCWVPHCMWNLMNTEMSNTMKTSRHVFTSNTNYSTHSLVF